MAEVDKHKVELDNLEDLQRVFDSIESDITDADWTDTLTSLIPDIENKHQEGFGNRQSPGGEPWAPWQFRTADISDTHPTLEASGRLRESLTEGGPDHVSQVTETELVWGTSVEYAGLHQEGATITTGVWLVARGGGMFLPPGSTLNIAQREFVGLSSDSVDDIAEQFADDAIAKIKGI